jgi:catechol 2,3-dioxygenase-like lactoylglutathione lyase family enzyme
MLETKDILLALIAVISALLGAMTAVVNYKKARQDRAEAKEREARLREAEGHLDDWTRNLHARPPESVSLSLTPPFLHHISLPVRDLERSTQFYGDRLGLQPLPRDEMGSGVKGAWFGLPGGQQVHLLVNPKAAFRNHRTARREVYNSAHFAIRVDDLRARFQKLKALGAFLEVHPHVAVERYPHFYTLDPDDHVIEFNAEPPT